jgi:hypothetical protein
VNSYLQPAFAQAVLGLALLASAPANGATTHQLTLVGDVQNLIVDTGVGGNPPITPYVHGRLDLADATSGSTSLPGFTFAVGDTVRTQLDLVGAINMPDGASWSGPSVSLAWMSAPGTVVEYRGTFSFWLQGSPANAPVGFTMYGGSGGAFTLGGYVDMGDPPAFSFDSVVFEVVVDRIYDWNTGQQFSSASTATSTPWASYVVWSPVPEVSSFALFVLGVATMLSRRITTRRFGPSDA